MAYEEAVQPITVVANADLSAAADQYKFVEGVAVNGENRCTIANAGTDIPLGVLNEGAISGQPCKIAVGGVTKVRLGATLSAGVRVAAGSDGRAVAAGTGAYAFGLLMQGGVAGDIVAMLIQPLQAAP